MKRYVKMISMLMVMVVLMMTLASCGSRLSGTYSTTETLGSKVSYTFDGSEVTIKVTVLGFTTELNGEYVIEDDQITFTFEGDEVDANSYEGSHKFEKGDDYIKIGGTKLTKVD